MKITIKSKKISLTPAIRAYAEDKIVSTVGRLTKSMDTETIALTLEMGRFTNHHRKGDIWGSVATLGLQGRVLRAEAHGESLHASIDLLREEVERELKGYKEKVITTSRRESRRAKKDEKIARSARFNRKGRIREEGL